MIYKVLVKKDDKLGSPIFKHNWRIWTIHKTKLGKPKYSNILGKEFEVNRGFCAFFKLASAIEYCKDINKYFDRYENRNSKCCIIVFEGIVPSGAYYFDDVYTIIANKMGIIKEIYKIEIN